MLLDTLLALLDADADASRASAAEQLGKLGDERAVLPLVSTLRDPEPSVRGAAALALGAYPRPRAELALWNVLDRENEALPVRVAAMRALGRHQTPTAGRQLLAYYEDRDRPAPARAMAEQVLEESYPELLAAAGRVPVVENTGRLVLVPAAAGLGAYALGAVGALGVNSDTAVPIGVVGGLSLGGAAAYLITADTGITMPQGIWFATTGGWGTIEGLLLGAALQPAGGSRVTTAGGLVGELSGLGLFLYSREELALQSEELAAVNLSGGAGLLGGLGLSLLLKDLSSEGTSAVVATGGLVGLTASALAAPSMEVTAADAGLVSVATAHGVTVGALLPSALGQNINDQPYPVGGALLGGALAYAASATASPFVHATREENVRLLTLPGFGYFFGGGLPLLLENSDGPTMSRSALGGAAVGTAGALLAPEYLRLDPGDGAFVPAVAAFGFWQGLGWAIWLDGRDTISTDQAIGMSLSSLGLAGWGAVAAARPLDVKPLQTLALTSGAFWGVWYAGFTGYLLDARSQQVLSATLLTSDAGVVGAIGLLALGVDESRIGIASAGGLTGAALASLGAALATRDGKQVATANLIGTTVGIAGGALFGGHLLQRPGGGDGVGGAGLSLGELVLEPGMGQVLGAHNQPVSIFTLSLR